MSAPWKTIRDFISSTFKDMHAERDHLVRFVFPRLRERLLKHRVHLVDVDLRWGVTGEDDATEVCRDVVKECRPRFLCILGGRYGHIPTNAEKSITADEIEIGVFNPPPDNPPPDDRGPVRAFFYFRKDEATNAIPDEDARTGAYREFPQPKEIEEHGAAEAERRASERAAKLTQLKEEIERRGLPVRRYAAAWDAAQKRLVDLQRFGDLVLCDLFKSIKADPKLAGRFHAAANVAPDEFTEEAEQMEAFIEERTDHYIVGSREPLLKEMLAFAADDGTPNVFVLTGNPGSGKSALLAEFVAAIVSPRESTRSAKYFASSAPFRGQQFLVIPHFIGASAGSTDLRRTLRRLCHDIARAAGNIKRQAIN